MWRCRIVRSLSRDRRWRRLVRDSPPRAKATSQAGGRSRRRRCWSCRWIGTRRSVTVSVRILPMTLSESWCRPATGWVVAGPPFGGRACRKAPRCPGRPGARRGPSTLADLEQECAAAVSPRRSRRAPVTVRGGEARSISWSGPPELGGTRFERVANGRRNVDDVARHRGVRGCVAPGNLAVTAASSAVRTPAQPPATRNALLHNAPEAVPWRFVVELDGLDEREPYRPMTNTGRAFWDRQAPHGVEGADSATVFRGEPRPPPAWEHDEDVRHGRLQRR